MSIKHLYPTSTPTLNLNSKSSRVVDPRISTTRASTATYVDPVSGFIKTAPANVARVEKDGLLVEESRTNSIANSAVFSSGYGASNVAATDNVTTAPDGTTTAASLMETGGSGFHNFFRPEITSGAAGDYAQSIFVKNNGRAYVNLRWLSISVANCWHTVTFALIGDGTITQEQSGSGANFTNISRSIEHIRNGWYRITLGASNPNARIYPWILDGSDGPTPTLNSLYGVASYTGDVTKGYYIWGAQVEETGTFSTSYIPTSGSTVTRNADEVSFLNNNFTSWYDNSQGAFLIDINTLGFNGDYARIMQTNQQHRFEYSVLSSAGGKQLKFNWNFGGETRTQNGTAPLGDLKLGASYSVGSTSPLYNNGTSIASITNVATGTFTAPTELRLCRQSGNSQYLSSYVKRLVFYQAPIANTALEALTQ